MLGLKLIHVSEKMIQRTKPGESQNGKLSGGEAKHSEKLGQYHDWWWPVDARSQVIISHGMCYKSKYMLKFPQNKLLLWGLIK